MVVKQGVYLTQKEITILILFIYASARFEVIVYDLSVSHLLPLFVEVRIV
jgi:hypothetical protein